MEIQKRTVLLQFAINGTKLLIPNVIAFQPDQHLRKHFLHSFHMICWTFLNWSCDFSASNSVVHAKFDENIFVLDLSFKLILYQFLHKRWSEKLPYSSQSFWFSFTLYLLYTVQLHSQSSSRSVFCENKFCSILFYVIYLVEWNCWCLFMFVKLYASALFPYNQNLDGIQIALEAIGVRDDKRYLFSGCT